MTFVSPKRRLVICDGDLLVQLVADANPGARFTVDWGEPNQEGYYEPSFTRHTEDDPSEPCDIPTEDNA